MAKRTKTSEHESSGKSPDETPVDDIAAEAATGTDDTNLPGEDTAPDDKEDSAGEAPGAELEETGATEAADPVQPVDDTLGTAAADDTLVAEDSVSEAPGTEADETGATVAADSTHTVDDTPATMATDDTLDTELAGDTVVPGPTDDTPHTEPADDTLDAGAAASGRFDDGDTQALSSTTDDSLRPEAPAAGRETPRESPAEPPRQSRGVIPLLLGGVLAGLIGFGASYYVTSTGMMTDTSAVEALRQDTQDRLSAQSDRIAALSDQVGALPEPPDMTGVETAVGDLGSRIDTLAGRVDDHAARIEELSSKLSQLESRPIVEAASDAAVAAYEAELKKLQDAMAAQRAEIEAMTNEARALEDKAEETAQATMRRAALSRIQTALDAGGSFAEPLADLQQAGVETPDILVQTAETGVPTLSELQAQFPDAAREALAAARGAAAESGETGGWQAFLKTQLGVRSLEPREGNDPDAILSRAEAATHDGRLKDALAEIDALPEVAQEELSDWSARAARRLEAVAAAQTLSEQLN